MVKKIFLIAAIVFIASGVVMALNWYSTNQITFAWQAVTTDTGSIEYEVFLVNADVPAAKDNLAIMGRTAETEYLLTIEAEGKWTPGVRSVKVINGTDAAKSIISWADDESVCRDGKSFGIVYYQVSPVEELHIKEAQ